MALTALEYNILKFLMPNMERVFISEQIYETVWDEPVAFIYGFLFSLSIEISQIFSNRITDIDDSLMNTAGIIAGHFLFIGIRRIALGILRFSIDDTNHWRWEPYFCFALARLIMFFVLPFIVKLVIGYSDTQSINLLLRSKSFHLKCKMAVLLHIWALLIEATHTAVAGAL